jgi:hypothetical protein
VNEWTGEELEALLVDVANQTSLPADPALDAVYETMAALARGLLTSRERLVDLEAKVAVLEAGR